LQRAQVIKQDKLAIQARFSASTTQIYIAFLSLQEFVPQPTAFFLKNQSATGASRSFYSPFESRTKVHPEREALVGRINVDIHRDRSRVRELECIYIHQFRAINRV
jgi:hypothetical protein